MEDEEYKKLSVEERCVHKLWKARVSGYEDATKLFNQIADEKSPEFAKYLSLVKHFVVDSNALGQEKGLEATLAFVDNFANAGRTVNDVMSGVVHKCLAASKTKTRLMASQLILLYIEIGKCEAVQEELIKGMDQKNPKIVAACINACTTALQEFGAKVVSVKPLVKKITPLFADRDKIVRDEARGMVIEIYHWIGPALRSQLNGLQPVQLTELETEFNKINGQKVAPLRLLRSQQQKQALLTLESNETNGVVDCEISNNSKPIDAYDLSDPIDILSKLPKDFYDKLETKKWTDRKEALEELENLVKTPKLENGDYGDLVRGLKKVIQKDSNVVCVALATRCITGLANGLKKRFQTYSSALISTLLEKFKEKKQNVVTAVRDAIDATYSTTNIEQISEDVIEALSNKNPSVKQESASFLTRCFSKTSPNAINKKLLKAFVVALIKLTNEPDPTVRDNAVETIGTLMKLMGEKIVNPFLVELEKDTIKMAKIKECCDKAVVTKTGNVKTAPIANKTTTNSNMATAKIEHAPIVNHATIKKGSTLSVMSTVPNTKQKTVKSSAKTQKSILEKELDESEAVEIVGTIWTLSLLNEICSANWKNRLEASEKLLSEIQLYSKKDVPTQAVIKVLSRKPGFKDTNFQVLKVKFDIIRYLAENCTFSIVAANCCLTDLAEKFADAKNSSTVAETMTCISQAIGLNNVVNVILDYAFEQKNPKVVQEILIWLSAAIRDFGLGQINVKFLIDNIKKGLSSTNPNVRQAAISLSGVLYMCAGATIKTFFESEKSAIRDALNTEFDKYEGLRPRTIKSSASANCLGSSNQENVDQDDDENVSHNNQLNLHDILPRVDISGQITEALIAELEDKNWKVRNEALTKVTNIIQEAKVIKPNIGDLGQALVHRLSDSNTKIAQTSLTICEALARAMGPATKQYVRVFFPHFLQSLGDSKSWMRASALAAIGVFEEQCGCKEFFDGEMIGDALKSGSPTLRVELWTWLSQKVPNIPTKQVPKDELLACVPHLYASLEDRNVDVRKMAQEAILGIMIHLGYDCMVKHTEKLKPGSKATIMAALEKVRPNLPVIPLSKKTIDIKEDKAIRGTKPVATSKNIVKPKSANANTKSTSNATRKKDDEIDTSPLLSMNNLKHQRTIDESKLKVLKWNFTTPREEFFDLLKDQMNTANVNKTLMTNMFHSDFRYHIRAIESLMDDLPLNIDALIANLDLILKWLTLRFLDTNPSVLLKSLEYLQLVFNMLKEQKYQMLENEASSFLPFLVLKLGDPKDAVRSGVRSLCKQICHIYQPSRLFTNILEGLKSKNARQRVECLEMLDTIVQDYGLGVCTPTPNVCLKEIAKQISDRDNSVRSAALNCVVQAYHLVGDKVYKMIGNISDKDLSLLEERVKRSKKIINAKIPLVETTTTIHHQHISQKENISPTTHNNDASPTVNNEILSSPLNNSNSEDLDEDDEDDEQLRLPCLSPSSVQQHVQSGSAVNGGDPPIGAEDLAPFSLDYGLIQELDKMMDIPSKQPIKEFNLDFLYEEISVPSISDVRSKLLPSLPPKRVELYASANLLHSQMMASQSNDEFLKKIHYMGAVDVANLPSAIQQVNDIIQSRSNHLFVNYENEFAQSIVSQMKQLSNKDPQQSNVEKAYKNILFIMDEFYANPKFGRAISVENLKSLMDEFILLLISAKLEDVAPGENYVRNINFVCAKIIEKSDHTRIICAMVTLMQFCIRTEDLDSRRTTLVMKSLWRLIKAMPTWEDEIGYDDILFEIHNFLKEFPTIWWRNKSMDTQIRTVKTIVHTCAKIKGANVLTHLTKIPNKRESELESYILKLLKELKIDQAVLNRSPIHKKSTRAIHSTLCDIFKKVSIKEEAKEGLVMLYEFMQKCPEANIQPFIEGSPQVFQDYIHNGLKDIENARKKNTTKIDNSDHQLPSSSPPITASVTSSNDVTNDHNPEYWMQRLNAWKKAFPSYQQ